MKHAVVPSWGVGARTGLRPRRMGTRGAWTRGTARKCVAAAVAGAAAVAPRPAAAQDAHLRILGEKFQAGLEEIADAVPGVLGIQVLDLTGGERFGVNEELVFPQGSAIKVAILTAMYVGHARGELDVNRRVPVRAADRVGGSGYLTHFGDGTSELSLHDLAVFMITISDNMATNILIDQVGMEKVTAIMAELGFANMKLQRKMIRPEESAKGNENLSTPAEAAGLMARILRCELPMPEALCREMRAVLEIPHEGPIQDAIPRGITVGQKTGGITGVRTNWGYVDLPGRPFALAVMGNYGESDEMSDAIREVAELSYHYFSRLAGATPYGTRVPVELRERVRQGRPPR